MTDQELRTYVVALGGNAILGAGQKGTVEEQLRNLNQTGRQLLELFGGRNRVVITHGNGPQVGNLLLALEVGKEVAPMSLDVCVAATQGFMGYMIQQTVANCLREKGLRHNITTVVSQIVVDENDPAFERPTKERLANNQGCNPWLSPGSCISRAAGNSTGEDNQEHARC
jgi:carbamate kinase